MPIIEMQIYPILELVTKDKDGDEHQELDMNC